MMEKPDPFDYVVGASLRGGGTVRGLMMQLGVGRARASYLLWEIPPDKVVIRTRDGVRSEKVWVPSGEVDPVNVRKAWTRFTRAARRRRVEKDAGGTRHEQAKTRADEARLALAEGNWEKVATLLRDPVLSPADIRRHITRKWTDQVLGNLWTLKAGAAMESGDPKTAERFARLALRRKTDPEMRARAWGIRGAALRMLGPQSLPESIEAYNAGIEESLQHKQNLPTWVLRNLHASAVAPLMAMGNHYEAAEYLDRAQCYRHADDPSGVENDVRIAQLHVASGRKPQIAFDALERVANTTDAPFYIEGWRARCEASFIVVTDRDPNGFNKALLRSWESNSGYGFQRLLVVARLAASPDLFCADVWPRATLLSVGHYVAIQHRARHGTRPSECDYCISRQLPERAAHALGFKPGKLPQFLAT